MEFFINKNAELPVLKLELIRIYKLQHLRKENLSKGSNSLFTAEILLANVTERNNNKIKISELWNFL